MVCHLTYAETSAEYIVILVIVLSLSLEKVCLFLNPFSEG